jgi:hypothetical protein
MASTLTRKRRRSPKVGDLTVDEFRDMVTDIIDARLNEWADPDAGLELRPEVIESIQRQRAEYAAGKRGKSLEEVSRRLGLD